jgi:hypothetical protein
LLLCMLSVDILGICGQEVEVEAAMAARKRGQVYGLL